MIKLAQGTRREEPLYSKLLDKLTSTPIERVNILKPYFEPTKENLEQGIKVPTQTHKIIAKLISDGYFRTIITTNFDRLMEKALEDQGITPTVITTDDSLEGALPYIHSRCTIIKVEIV